MRVSEVFDRITSALGEAGIAYMLAGSFASAYYGAPRTTQGVDLVIRATADQLRTFVQILPPDQYDVDLHAALEAHKHQSLFNVVDMATGWRIDFIIRKSRPFSEEEFRRRTLANLEGRPLFVASAEDVVVSKLEWAKLAQSERHIEDVAGIFRMRWDSLDRAYLERWISELRIEAEWNDARRAAGV
jgi:pimeloyl-ACP methyl ester carboxylesterase